MYFFLKMLCGFGRSFYEGREGGEKEEGRVRVWDWCLYERGVLGTCMIIFRFVRLVFWFRARGYIFDFIMGK